VDIQLPVQLWARRLQLGDWQPMFEAMKYGFARPAGGRRRFARPVCIVL
jgi:hypothetical protein